MGALRFLLAVCVLCAHSRALGGLRWLGGDLAVELFFVISGFYMQLVLQQRYSQKKLGPKWRAVFYTARYARLLPVYLIGFALSLAWAAWRPHVGAVPVWRAVWDLPSSLDNLLFKAFLVVTNLTMAFQDVMMFLAAHDGHVHWSADFRDSQIALWRGLAIPQAWSLGIELSFYALAPFLLHLRTRWLLGLAALSLGAKVTLLAQLHLDDPWTYRFFPFEVGYFLLGAVACRWRGRLHERDHGPAGPLCAYAVAAALTLFYRPVPLAAIVYPVALACVLPFMFAMTARSTYDRLLGEVSYPFYIFHLVALDVAEATVAHTKMSPDMTAWLGLLFTLALSTAGVVFELRFIEPWRSRLGTAPTFDERVGLGCQDRSAKRADTE